MIFTQGATRKWDCHSGFGNIHRVFVSYFSEQLADNASRGLINRVTDVKLLHGDLAEAWREGRTDYATVAMKYALKDSMVERARTHR